MKKSLEYFANQTGGGLLAVITVMGIVMVLTQGSMYYRSSANAKFVGSEKNKILAQQMAEAGVEDNIGELGTRNLKVTPNMVDYITFSHKSLGGGSYSSKLTTVGTGALADTIDLTSTGVVGTSSQKVQARLKLKKFLDSTRVPLIVVTPETTLTITSHTVPETTTTVTVMDPNAMPDLNVTPAYIACFASGAKKCDVCHLPGGDVSKANVINIAKPAIGTHISHHGDYVTTDGSCDMYKPKTVKIITNKTVPDTLRVIVNRTTYDTTVTVDTAIKVQFLSWK
jgi:hypothetical protein